MEPVVRFELTTVRLQIGCSTTELNRLEKTSNLAEREGFEPSVHFWCTFP